MPFLNCLTIKLFRNLLPLPSFFIGAELAVPDKPVVAIVGDGAFLINGMEVTTTVNYIISLYSRLVQQAFSRSRFNIQNC